MLSHFWNSAFISPPLECPFPRYPHSLLLQALQMSPLIETLLLALSWHSSSLCPAHILPRYQADFCFLIGPLKLPLSLSYNIGRGFHACYLSGTQCRAQIVIYVFREYLWIVRTIPHSKAVTNSVSEFRGNAENNLNKPFYPGDETIS